MEIRKIRFEDGLIYYGIVNTRDDEHAKLATTFSPTEIDLFKKILEEVINSNHKEAHRTDCVNLGRQLKPAITPQKAESAIETMASQFWLSIDNGIVSLGVRTILELRSYLEATFEGQLTECVLCHELVVKGTKCGQRACQTFMHNYCKDRWFSRKKAGEPRCPTCDHLWPKV